MKISNMSGQSFKGVAIKNDFIIFAKNNKKDRYTVYQGLEPELQERIKEEIQPIINDNTCQFTKYLNPHNFTRIGEYGFTYKLSTGEKVYLQCTRGNEFDSAKIAALSSAIDTVTNKPELDIMV